uniref:RING-type domain-containing protein n=1 Tax=Haptolina brevifila TaxID=156173 RepID=A0A7S2DPG9_9EUKA|mmetsp:Transcript_41958/g.84203  ORF Transcript_41958/g.84203 Transcript_41958/m.84203 type:complete len:286 (+) Transcript_41958:164-1021(+)
MTRGDQRETTLPRRPSEQDLEALQGALLVVTALMAVPIVGITSLVAGINFVARTTCSILLLGWPLAPRLRAFLARWDPRKADSNSGARRLRTLMSQCWGYLARPAARQIDRALHVMPNGLARHIELFGEQTPTLGVKLGLLLAAAITALPVALSMALGLAALLHIMEVVGRLTALLILLGWPLAPSLRSALSQCPLRQPGRLGWIRRLIFCTPAMVIPPTSNDDCPICWEPLLLDQPSTAAPILEHCRWGCGRAVHSGCMRGWAAAGCQDGGSGGACVLCRTQWR